MLATLAEPFDEEGWAYEIKWDGYRAVAMINGKTIKLLSRNDKSFEEKFSTVFQAIREWDIQAIIDGEIVVLDDQGQPDFGALQNWRRDSGQTLVLYVFDLMWYNGYDLTKVEWTGRRALLQQLVPPGQDIIRMSESFETTATAFLAEVAKLGLEGIMAKKTDSFYTPGYRTRQWLKMKANQRHEVVIGGFTQNEGTVKTFSSLLVGLQKRGKLQYIGKVGTGFSVASQKEIMAKMKPLIQKTNPFSEAIDVNKPSRFNHGPLNSSVTWLKPVLVGEVSYAEMTTDGIMRHPSFEGLREDKSAGQVKEEKTVSASEIKKAEPKKTTPMATTEKSKSRSTATAKKTTTTKSKTITPSSANELIPLGEKDRTLKVNGHALEFTNLNKLYWPKITKRELLNYYHDVADFILPYIKDRPLSLNRHPDGFSGKSFYQKDLTGKAPAWAKLHPYRTEDEDIDKNFLVGQKEDALLFMVNLGCIEINPWNSTIQKPDHPTWCVIDLDPDKNRFESVVEVAQVTHEILEAAQIDSYCKTSGSTGLHIYIPLNAKYTYEQSKEFARYIVTLVQARLPKTTSIERLTSKRKGKIYLDFLQNRPQATLACAYSARPKPNATVSMPLYWKEVISSLRMGDFTISNVLPLLKKRGDLFKPVLGKGIDMMAALRRLEENSKSA